MSTPLLLTVFTASVAGSLHCVGMCGSLMACATATPGSENGNASAAQPAVLGPGFQQGRRTRSTATRFAPHTAYHLTRGVGYVALGVAAGALGALLDLTGTLAGLMPLAGVVAGGMLLLIAFTTVAHAMGWRLGSRTATHAPPGPVKLALQTVQRRAFALPPFTRAAVLGSLTPLLPCGWLYAFALVAAGTGSIALGASVMLAFWLGTLPVLLALGLGLQGLLAQLRQRAPKLTAWATAAALLFIGATLFTGRLGIDPAQLAMATQAQADDTPNGLPDPQAAPACCPLMDAANNRRDNQP